MPASDNTKSNLDILDELTASLINVNQDINLYEETLNLLPMGVAVISSRIVTWANRSALDLFGYDNLSEVTGKNSNIFYASRDEYERAGKKCYPNGGHTLAKMKRKNGGIVWIFINVHVSNMENGRAFVIFCSLDNIRRLCGYFGEEQRYN